MPEFVDNLVNTNYEHTRWTLNDQEANNNASTLKFLGVIVNAQFIQIVYDWSIERGWPKE